MTSETTFAVSDFTPVDVVTEIVSAPPAGYARRIKIYADGTVDGRHCGRTALWTDGTADGRAGAFGFVRSAATSGEDRTKEFLVIVPDSGTNELARITASARLTVDAGGTHRRRFDYAL